MVVGQHWTISTLSTGGLRSFNLSAPHMLLWLHRGCLSTSIKVSCGGRSRDPGPIVRGQMC